MLRLVCGDYGKPQFSHDSRITMLPCVSAACDAGPALSVFKGSLLPYREFLADGAVHIETLQSQLPRDSLLYMRKDSGNIDAKSFYQFAVRYCDHVRYITTSGRKFLLIFEAHRCHMTIRALQYFAENNVVVYALPSNTSGKTQPCDRGLFGKFKQDLNFAISNAAAGDITRVIDQFELRAMIRYAYQRDSILINDYSRF